MRDRIIGVTIMLAFALVIAGAGMDAVREHGAVAQEATRRPLFANEVARWCTVSCSGVFTDIGDGWVRFVINGDNGLDVAACGPVMIPDGVEGWGYAVTAQQSLAPIPTYPANSTQAERDAIDATWVANNAGPFEEFAPLTVDELRQRADLPVCELVVRSAT